MLTRLRALLTVIAAAVVLCGVRAHVQGVSGRTIVSDIAPPPIDVGLVQDTSRAPDSPEMIQHRGLRSSGGVVDRVGAAGATYVPGKVIVKFKDGVSSAARLSTMSVSRAQTIEQPAYADFQVMRIDPSEDAEALADTLRQRSDVEWAQAAYRVHTMMVPNDTFYQQGLQWNFPLIDMERAWDIQPQAGSSITVAVVDTGVAYTNQTIRFNASAFSEDTQGNILPPGGTNRTQYPALGALTLQFVAATQLAPASRFVAPHDFIWNDDTPVDLDGHGTHVSGTIGQTTNDAQGTAGLAFNVKLMPVKVIDSEWDDIFGSPNQGTDDIVAQGVRYAADNGAKVINMSIGRSGPPAPAVEAAINYAVSKGAFVAVAAGNGFEDGNPTEVIAEIASRVRGAVSVAAVTRQKTHAYYSTTGSWVELAAPGGSFRESGASGGILQQTMNLNLITTFQNPPTDFARTPPRFDSLAYFYFIGTSQATPHVSGLAALLMQQGITSPAAIEAALEKFATDLGDPGKDNTFGYGLIEARSTLRGLGLAR